MGKQKFPEYRGAYYAGKKGQVSKMEKTRITARYRTAMPTTFKFSVYIVTFFIVENFKVKP